MIRKPRTQGDLSQNIRENLVNFGTMYSAYANKPTQDIALWILRGISQYLRTLFQTHLELMSSAEEGGSATTRLDILERISVLIDRSLGDGDDVIGILEAQLSAVKDVIGACTINGLEDVADELGRLIRGVQKHEEALANKFGTYISILTEGMSDLKEGGLVSTPRPQMLNVDSVALAVSIAPPPVTSFTTGPSLMAAVGHWDDLFSIFGFAVAQQSQKFLMNHPAQLDNVLMGLGVAYQTMTSKFRARISQYKPPALQTPTATITAHPLRTTVAKQTNQSTTKGLVADWRINKLVTGGVMGSLRGSVEDLLGETVAVDRGAVNLDGVMEIIKGGGVIVAAAQLQEFKMIVDSLVDMVYNCDRNRFVAAATTDVLGDYVIALTKALEQLVTALVAVHGAIIELDPSFTQVGNNLRALVGVVTERDLLVSEREALFTNYQQAMGAYTAAVEEAVAVRNEAQALTEHNKKKSELELQRQLAADTIKIQDLKAAHEKTLTELRTQNGLLKISGEEAQARVKGESFLQGTIADLQRTVTQLQERNTKLTQESGDREGARKALETELKKRDQTIHGLEADLKGARLSLADQEKAALMGKLTATSLGDRIKDLENNLKRAQAESTTIRREGRAHQRRRVMAVHSRTRRGGTGTLSTGGTAGVATTNSAIHERCMYVKKTLAALNKSLTVRVTQLEKDLSQSDKKLRDVSGKLHVETGALEDLRGRYAAALQELGDLRVDRAGKAGGKKDVIETLSSENTKLRIAATAAEAQIQDMTAQLQDLRKNYVAKTLLTTVSKKVVTLTGELETHKKLEMKHAQEREATNRRIEALTLENVQLKAQVESTKSIEQLKKQLGTVTTQLGAEEGKRLAMNQELVALKSTNDQLNGQVKELRDELGKVRRGGDTQIEKLRGHLTTKDAELVEVKGALETARLSATNQGAEVKRLMGEISTLRKTVLTLQTNLDSRTDTSNVEAGKQRGEVLRIKEELKTVTRDHTEKQKAADARIKGLETRILDLEAQLVSAGARAADLEAQLVTASERLREREGELREQLMAQSERSAAPSQSERSVAPSTGSAEWVAQSERSQVSQPGEAMVPMAETDTGLREEIERVQALLEQGVEVAAEQAVFIKDISGRYTDLYQEFVNVVGHVPTTPPLSEMEIPGLAMDDEEYDEPIVDDLGVDLMGTSYLFDAPRVSGESVPMVALRGYSPQQDPEGSMNSQISVGELEPPVESGVEAVFAGDREHAINHMIQFNTTPGHVVDIVDTIDTSNIDMSLPPTTTIPISILPPPAPQPRPALRRSPRLNKPPAGASAGTSTPTAPPRAAKRKGAGVDAKRVRVTITASNMRKILSEKPPMTPHAIYQNIIAGTNWDIGGMTFMTQAGDVWFHNMLTGQRYGTEGVTVTESVIVWEQKRIFLLMICVKHGVDPEFIIHEDDLSWFISYNEAKDVEGTSPIPPVTRGSGVIIEEDEVEEVAGDEEEEEEDDDL
ncbi:ORF22 [Silurid herpesvirus 1]|nr:ORF22 [Silurid herpesvirus 1]